MRFLVLISLWLAVGCSTTPGRVRKPGDEWLAAIKIEGSKALDRDETIKGLALHRALAGGRALDPYQLSIDTERIRAAYLRLGFFEVEVTSHIATRTVNKTIAQTVIFKVVEGRRSKTQVEIRGLPPEISPARARSVVALKDGEPFDYTAYDLAKQVLLRLIEDAGYPHVQLQAAVLADKAQGVATARYEIEAGTRATFGVIAISGTEGQLADAIMGRLDFSTGDPYSAAAITRSQRALYDLGRFSTVRIEPDRSAGSVVPVKISVTLGKLRELRYGFGLGYDPVTAEVRGRVGISVIPRAHPLWTLASDFRPSLSFTHQLADPRLKLRALVSAKRLDMFAPNVTGELEASADYLTLEAYRTYGPRFRAGVSTPLGAPWLLGRVGLLFEYLVFDEVFLTAPADITRLNLDENQRRGAVEMSLEADLRDNRLEPHFGLLASLRAAQGSPIMGGATTYTQVTPELRVYLPVGKKIVFAARGRLGLLFGDVPVTERYYSGGASSQRGFPHRRLSPTAPGLDDGEPAFVVIGGIGLIETGGELRVPLGNVGIPVGTQIFLDGGDVVENHADLDPFGLHWAVGAGLYGQVAGLKLRIDVGYRLNRTAPPERSPDSILGQNVTLHFGVGESY
ncbi:MAG: BamA/TamA family outer membrane protein [Deltaproteobacteria bacterium]|nr:BamA/TamA family outer membrane protein [Deltaproteobacteria bacterium]